MKQLVIERSGPVRPQGGNLKVGEAAALLPVSIRSVALAEALAIRKLAIAAEVGRA